MTPINALPTEMLGQIFTSVVSPMKTGYGRLYYRQIAAICLTCCRWCEVAERTPMLWTLIPATVSPEIVSRALLLSSHCLLTVDLPRAVTFAKGRRREDPFVMDPHAFLPLAVPQLSRWESAKLQDGIDEDYLPLITTLPRSLKSLDMYYNQPGPAEVPCIVFHPKAEIEELRLTNLEAQLDGDNLASLRVLRLHSTNEVHSSYQAVSALLAANCAVLRELSLCRIAGQDITNAASTKLERIAMPSLSRFCVTECPEWFTFAILARIHAPALQNVQLRCTGSQPPWQSILSNLRSTRERFMHCAQRLDIWLSGTAVSIRIKGSIADDQFQINLPSSAEEELTWAAEIALPLPVSTLISLRIHHTFVPTAAFFTTFGHLGNVTAIHCASNDTFQVEEMHDFIQALANPVEGVWLFPYLEDLRLLQQCCKESTILDMVLSRYGHVGASTDYLPKPLEYLKWKEDHDAEGWMYLKEVEDVVGQHSVDWTAWDVFTDVSDDSIDGEDEETD